MAVDARNFLLNTDYPIDKIVYLTSGSMTLDGLPHTIAHGLPFIPLVGGYWSFSSSFDTTYDFYSGDFPSGNPSFLFAHEVQISSDATNITLNTTDIIGDSPTFYYRIYALAPSTMTSSLNPVLTASADAFILNTDYNYMKLYINETYTMGTAATYTVTHSLGYKPRIAGWYEFFGSTEPILRAGDTSGGIIKAEVTDTQVIVSNGFGLNIPNLYLRIYLDA